MWATKFHHCIILIKEVISSNRGVIRWHLPRPNVSPHVSSIITIYAQQVWLHSMMIIWIIIIAIAVSSFLMEAPLKNVHLFHQNNHPLKDESNDKALISPLQVHRSNNLRVCTTQFGHHPCHHQKIKTHPNPNTPWNPRKPTDSTFTKNCGHNYQTQLSQ